MIKLCEKACCFFEIQVLDLFIHMCKVLSGQGYVGKIHQPPTLRTVYTGCFQD